MFVLTPLSRGSVGSPQGLQETDFRARKKVAVGSVELQDLRGADSIDTRGAGFRDGVGNPLGAAEQHRGLVRIHENQAGIDGGPPLRATCAESPCKAGESEPHH
jgi:hypothetical protein